jgi:hypothetical protein
MKKILEKKTFNHSIDEVWKVISDISRSDWVPGVENIELVDDTRVFKFKGMGDLVEKIITLDNDNYELHYSAIKTDIPINHHLAVIRLESIENKTLFSWSTEIDPDVFAEGIRNGMLASLAALEVVLLK